MNITILTLFPEMFSGPFKQSIIKNAQDKGLVTISFVDIRNFGIGKHKEVDDTPYGGGHGMVLRVDVLHNALKSIKTNSPKEKTYLMSARGKTFTQTIANDCAKLDSLILICGHYEGVDERISTYIDGELSVGDFVTTGGEIPAMAITDAIVRLIPGVLKDGVTQNESHSLKRENKTLLEHPQYTRPAEYEGVEVPQILLSGNHKEIENWRIKEAVKTTKNIREDLLK